MFRRFLRFRLNIERPVEANLLLVIDRHMQEAPQVVDLALHVGIQQGRIALTTSPEGVP
jgi:hypothetical protein